jgi:hypothetical protein
LFKVVQRTGSSYLDRVPDPIPDVEHAVRLAQPFLRALLIVEHTGCSHSFNK